MSTACKQAAELAKLWTNQDGTISDQILLLNAEYAFAEKSFLELSRQATAFQVHFHKITVLMKLFAVECNQLFLKMDKEMLPGQLTDEVPLCESSLF